MSNANLVKIWKEKNPKKVKAQRLVFCAIRNKSLKKKPCVVCGNPKSEAHHHDYNQPLLVAWLCKRHHGKADQQKRIEEFLGVIPTHIKSASDLLL